MKVPPMPRWPLQLQILIPLAALILFTVMGLSAWFAFHSADVRQTQIESQIEQVTRTIAESNFPLTDRTCQQMKGLTGAEFVVRDGLGKILATTDSSIQLPGAEQPRLNRDGPLEFAETIRVGSRDFFWAQLALGERSATSGARQINVLYPAEDVYRQRWQAIGPTIWFGGTACLLTMLTTAIIASRITRPLKDLGRQSARIAQGDFAAIPVPRRNDEVRDLAETMNTMARRLAEYERTTRDNERMRTLGLLGGGIAHQLRNSATGARLAIDLHCEQCHSESGIESLNVAKRQLILMEKYIQKFLTLGQPSTKTWRRVDLNSVADELKSLIDPFARHSRVAIRFSPHPEPLIIDGDPEAVEHLLLNLLLNAVQAANEREVSDFGNASPGQVEFVLSRANNNLARIEINDNGLGPPPGSGVDLFDPFVSGKPEGVGLGLSVAKSVCTDHGGAIAWQRQNDCTQFVVELPLIST